jgi:hypothetical protein
VAGRVATFRRPLTPVQLLRRRPPLRATLPRYPPVLVDSDIIGFSVSVATGSPVNFKSITVAIGDVLTVGVNIEDNNFTEALTNFAGTATTSAWTRVVGTNSGGNSRVGYWVATVTGAGTLTVRITISGGTPANSWWGASLRQWLNSEGAGASFAGLVQSNNLTEQKSDSTILVNVSDWSATNPGTPTWNGGLTTVTSGRDTGGVHYSWALAKLDDADTVSTTNYGLATPTFTTPTMAMLEVLGSTTAPSAVKDADATLTATATATGTAASDKPTTAALTGTATIAGTAAGTKSVDATLTATASITAAASVVKPVDATLTATATLTGTGQSTKPAAAALSATATLTGTASSTKPVDATLTGTATLSATAASTKPVDATLSVTATITADASVTSAGKNIDAAVTVTDTIAAAASSTKPVDSSLAAAAALSGTAASTKPVDAARSTTATLTATTDVTKPVTSALTGTATVTPAAASTKPVTSTLTGTATITADATVGVPPVTIAAAPTFTATLTATGQGVRPATSALAATATITATAAVTRNAQASLPIAAQLTASAFVGVEVIGMDQGTSYATLLSGTAFPGPTLDGSGATSISMDLARSTASSLG